LPAEVPDLGCERLAAETSFARLLIVDKPDARLHFRTHLIWFLKLFWHHIQEAGIKGRILLACIEMLRFGIPRHAQSASIGENSGEILRSIYVRLNIAVEFEDILGKRALALSRARLPRESKGSPISPPRLPLAGSDLAADHYIEPSASRRPPYFEVPAPGLA
jgi:hypothetical protein